MITVSDKKAYIKCVNNRIYETDSGDVGTDERSVHES